METKIDTYISTHRYYTTYVDKRKLYVFLKSKTYFIYITHNEPYSIIVDISKIQQTILYYLQK